MSKKNIETSKNISSHNYLNTQKSNAHTKVNGNLVQLWLGSANQTELISTDMEQGVLLDNEKTKKSSNKIFQKLFLGSLLIGGASSAYAIPEIPASNGGSVCAICAPPGWAVDNGTPDISNQNQAAASGTSGGGTAWDAAPLPLPPNGHVTWLSLRDLGPAGNEEIVSTDMTGLIPGYSYELSMYTLTSTGPYSTNYNDAFRYQVGTHPIQVISSLTHDTWDTTKFTFIANSATEHLQLLPGNNSPSGFQSVQIAVTLNAIKVIPVGMNDSFTMNQDSTLLGNVLADNGGGVDQPGDEAGGTTTVTAYDATSVNSGAVVVNPDGSFSYIPVAGFVGADTFTYSITDSNGYVSTATATVNVLDNVAPTIAITTSDANLIAGETATITFTLSEASTDFDASDVTVVGGTLSNFSGSGTNYTATFTPTTDSTVPTSVSVASAQFSDAEGNTNTDGADADNIVSIIVDADNDGIPDYQDIDDDNDGIPDLVELNGNPLKDTDNDGVIDSLDLDSDNDGILDIVEAGGIDSDNNGLVDDATDTDQDGLADIADTNPNSIDTPTNLAEALLVATLPVIDTDGDGTRDFQDVDSDSDGISDLIEGGTDPALDSDGDGDIDTVPVDPATGIATGITPSLAPNTDGDGVPDYRDLDSDNDGINDVIEAGGADTDGNGLIDTPNTLVVPADIPDENNDGTSDPLEPNNPNLPAALDENGDGVIDDNTDTDGDGIPDVLDGGDAFNNNAPLKDTDNDGIADIYDIDDDNDGIPDLIEQAGDPAKDTDGDGIVDSLDLDSDNDGILDILEAGGVDTNGDGVVDDATDTDNDGLADVVDANPAVADAPEDATEASSATNLPVIDTDGDGTPNFQDVDSDNDGMSDLVEGGLDPAVVDTNNDGMIDTTPDANNDGIAEGVATTGIATAANPATTVNPIEDTDSDGVPDYRDLDSDNDGLHDVVESGGSDEDEDGVIDTAGLLTDPTTIPDSDNNGTSDPLEPNNPNLSSTIDPDGNGIIDGPEGTDTDGDGIPDVTDKSDGFGNNGDTDNDGIPDIMDLDDDNDGIPDLVELNGNPTQDTDGDGIIDSLDLDSDNDGILDIIEAGGTDANRDGLVDSPADQDGDGLADVADANPSVIDAPANAVEASTVTTFPVTDTDHDGKPDFQDIDSDNDSISDLVEGGTDPALDTDNDGDIDQPVGETGLAINLTPAAAPDADNDGTPDYQDLDSDNDGLNDVSEAGAPDVDGNGQVDTPDTLTDATSIPDSDNNGTPDPLEPNNPNLPASIDANGDGVIDDATDTDGDGVPDVTDITPTSFGVLLDTDRDGIPDETDLDDDNDGIPDLVEQQTAQNGGDSDGDGVPDELDMDSDGDGLSDLSESGLTSIQILDLDSNNDGIIDAPVGSNGLADQIETDDTQSAGQDFDSNGDIDTPADTDNDGRPDFQDLDSDNDGIHDLNEGGDFDVAVVDTNNDGVIDDITEDADGDGIPDSIDSNDALAGGVTNTPADTDHDGIPDYQELDSDGDGIYDLIEGDTVDAATVDTNDDGILDNADVDSDNDGIPDSGDGDVAGYGDTQSDAPIDTDGDSIPDYNDLDSDNDSLSDVSEAGHEDLNEDGIFDAEGTRADAIRDTDNDGIPDFREIDSDNDGVTDIAGTPFASLDLNNDGRVDSIVDTDNDGVMDDVDTTPEQYGVRPSDDNLETAVSGFGGSTGPFGLLTMMMLLAVKRLRSNKLLQRFLPMFIVAMFIVPGLVAPTTAQAETKTFTNDTTAKSVSKCGTESAFNACNYVAGGFVMSHVDPEGTAGGWSTSDDMSSGFNVIVGRHFKPRWFAELSYTDMGDAELSNSSPSITDNESISYKVPSLHFGYLLREPSKSFNLYAKGGVSAIENEASATRVPFEKQTSVQASFGLGAQWQAKNSGLFARLGADFHDRDAVAAGLMFGYKFGKTQKQVIPKKVIKPAPVVKRKPVVKPVVVKQKPKPVVKKVIAKKPVKRAVRKVVKQPSFAGVLKGVNFHTDSAVLTPKAEAILKGVAQQLKRWNGLKVVLVGHTDDVGSASSNQTLSQKRANSVKAFLIKQGVKAHRMGTAGKGETQPRATNKTKDGRATNRRVELRAI